MAYRLHRVSGSPHEAGLALGRLVGSSLGASIERYVATWPPGDGVEQRAAERTTVFSNLACPATGEIWFACGDGPAASTGEWARVPWPW